MTQGFQIDCFIDCEVIVDNQPIRVEECHGYHYFDDSSYEMLPERVWIEIGGKAIDITDRLTKEELDLITNHLEPNTEI